MPALDAVVGRALGPVQAVQATGTCNECAPESAERACFEEHPFGATRVCAHGVARDCTEAIRAEVVDCGVDMLQCDPSVGWVPGERWEVRASEARRYVTEGDAFTLLLLSIWVENVTLPVNVTSDFFLHFRVEDPATGAEVELWEGSNFSFGHEIPATLPALVQVSFNGRTAAGLGATIPAINLRVRERPWDGLPLGEPMLVPVTDEAR